MWRAFSSLLNAFEKPSKFSPTFTTYFPYKDFLPLSPSYQKDNADALLRLAFNVTLSNYLKDPLPIPESFDYHTQLTGEVGLFETKRILGYCLFSETLNLLIFAFTGTYYWDEWESNIYYPQVSASKLTNYVNGVEVHSGFYKEYVSMKSQINEIVASHPTATIISTGHSMGGALSILCTFDNASANLYNYSFASPRIGNPNFAVRFNSLNGVDLDTASSRAFRVFNDEDIVTDAPLPKMGSELFLHTAIPQAFDLNLGSIVTNHVDAYATYYKIDIPSQSK